MRGTGEHRRIDALLEGAEVLGGEYDDYDPAAARERIARAVATCPPSARPPANPDTGWRYRTVHEQAAHDLDLAISLVVGSPGAAGSLARLIDHRRTEPEGALVFACLLHLVGHRDAAQFWWQFAAGGGSRTAAFCLCLHHRRLGEFRDADHWRRQAALLGSARTAARAPRSTAGVPGPHGFLLPDAIRRDLLSQCHRGRHPRLPAAVEAVVNRLRVDGDDEDYGEIPRPEPGLPDELAGPRPH
ncbi:hypothetical protein L7D48_26375 [Streptomyces sp. S1A]|uniref:hypothetical protein n=1 Tax=Streptomyces sp. ICN903 TaxID=2964654 RepID=UPI001EDC0D1F|nr:hypothetical protein [Streptomyces sp. ICN903]MCG3044061.1 hypothetical protein [Streptomyces sp. ICN903]